MSEYLALAATFLNEMHLDGAIQFDDRPHVENALANMLEEFEQKKVEELNEKLIICANHLVGVLEADPGRKMQSAITEARKWWIAYDRDI